MAWRDDSPTALDAWRSRVRASPDATAIAYFDGSLARGEVDDLSDAVAVVLRERGVRAGDVLGISLQNCPQFVLTVLALWKMGAVPLLVNPMYRGEELEHLLSGSGAVGVVCGTVEVEHVSAACRRVGAWTSVTSSRHFQTRDDVRVLGADHSIPPRDDLVELARRRLGERPEPVTPAPESCAFLTYTSGTTGPPKGAVNTHAAVLASASAFASLVGLDEQDSVLAMAPLFHITGAVINAVIALVSGSPLVLVERFHPEVVLDAIAEHGVTFTVAAITAYLALARSSRAEPAVFAGVRACYSGGAPVSAATVELLERRLGHYVHNVYGMTETTSAVVAVPLGTRAPVDPASGVLSVGKAMPGTRLRVLAPDGAPAGPGQQGELEVAGPSVVPGYWRNPEATAQAMPDGAIRTGDGAVVDDEGWVYLVDRLKDQINTSGYKVWPREVEEVLLRHDGVEQAAVVGLPDDYRGERVSAFVVPKPDANVTEAALIAWAREHLAAYKAPREVRLVAALPTTTSGKIQRGLLRAEPENGTLTAGIALQTGRATGMTINAPAPPAQDETALVVVDHEPLDSAGQVAAVIRFNRPDQLNAINWDTQRELAKALAAAEADRDVRAVLITGSGRGFSAGGDITAYRKLQADAEAFTEFVDEYCRLVEGIASMTKPVVALVNGICAAGGTELLLACDFAWAAQSARIGDMHINFAQIGGAGALARLPRLVGSSRALELVFSGRMLDAREALEWRLVNRIVPDEKLLEEGVEFARGLASKSPEALHYMKKTIWAGLGTDLAHALKIERDNALEYCLTKPDSMEGINAFIEKREPSYRDLR